MHFLSSGMVLLSTVSCFHVNSTVRVSVYGRCIKGLVLRVMLSEGGRVFRRWSLVGNIWVIKSNPLKEAVKPWSASLLLLPESQYHCCAGPQSSSYRMLISVGSPSCVTPSLEVEPLK